MEKLFCEFMHLYFWVYIVFVVLMFAINTKKEKSNKPVHLNPINVIGMVLFIMSFKY